MEQNENRKQELGLERKLELELELELQSELIPSREWEQEPTAASCIICDQAKPAGIRICEEFICDDCEAEMVRTDVKDAKYPFFIHQMNKIWLKMNA